MDYNTYAARAGRYTGLAYRQLVWALTQIDWAEVGRIVGHGLIALVVLTWTAGFELGRWVHAANDRLARLWVGVLVPEAATSSELQAAVRFDDEPTVDHFRGVTKMLPPAPAPVALLAAARDTEPDAAAVFFAVATLAAGGLSQRAIAKALGISRHRVKAALA